MAGLYTILLYNFIRLKASAGVYLSYYYAEGRIHRLQAFIRKAISINYGIAVQNK